MELAWLGLVPLAGAQPPNIVIGGMSAGIVTVLVGKQSPELALGIAVPFAVLAQVLINLLFTAYSPIMHKADEYAKEGNIKGIDMINFFRTGCTVCIQLLNYFCINTVRSR